MKKNILLNILKNEVEVTVGSTDPVAVTYAVASATKLLNEEVDRIELNIGPSVFKSLSIGVPGIKERGLLVPAAIGAYLHDYLDAELKILDYVSDTKLEKARKLIEQDKVTLKGDIEAPSAIYIKATVSSNNNSAWVIIKDNYSQIVEKGINDDIVYTTPSNREKKSSNNITDSKLEDLIEIVKNLEIDDLQFLLDATYKNKESALTAIKDDRLTFSKAVSNYEKSQNIQTNAINLAKFYTIAGSEARALGFKLPIVAIAGSGNHGITNFLGVLAVAETLNVDKLTLARALAISSVSTMYIKGYTGRASALCGCTIAAGVAVSAATVYLLGGTFKEINNAMNSVIGTLTGIICDGAKHSCCFKLSLAATTAIEYAFLATKKDIYIHHNTGTVSEDVEITIKQLAKLNNSNAMEEAHKCIFDIVGIVHDGNK